MHNTVTGKIDKFQQVVWFRDVVNQCLSYEMYNKWLPAKDFDADSAGAAVPFYTGPTANSVYPGWVFSDGKDAYVTLIYRRHKEWRHGRLAARIRYTSTTNTGDIAGKISIVPIDIDAAMPAASFVSITLPSPTTANGLQMYSPSSASEYIAVDPSNEVIVVSFGRETSDTSTGDLTFIGLDLIYKETKNRVSNRLDLTA